MKKLYSIFDIPHSKVHIQHSIFNRLYSTFHIQHSKIKRLLTTKDVKSRKRVLMKVGLVVIALLLPLAIIITYRAMNAKGAWAPTHREWAKRKQVTVTNDSPASLSAGTTVAITVDTKTLYDSSDLQDDCDDLRVLYSTDKSTWEELDRYVSVGGGLTCATSTATKVYFSLESSIAASAASEDYYLYYSNPDASAPTDTIDAFDTSSANALLVCPFDGTTDCINGDGLEQPTTESGAIRYSGAKTALGFDGVNDYVNAGSDSSLDNIPQNGDMTVEGWFYMTDTSSWKQLINKGVHDNDRWSFTIADWGGNKLVFRVWTSGTESAYAVTSQLPNANEWTHLVGTYKKSAGEVRLFINGVEPSYYQQTIRTDTPLDDSGYNVAVGAESDGTGISYNGSIDEVRISNVIRYTENFTPQTSPFVRDEYTKLLLHFDEGGDDPRNTGKAIDDSGNGNHGTITGAKYVAGLVGVDGDNTQSPSVIASGAKQSQSYAGHEGVFIEEGTTNLIKNPSFDHSTFNTLWGDQEESTVFNLSTSSATFTPNMAKRSAPGPFTTSPLIQGSGDGSGTSDTLYYSSGNQISGKFYENLDNNQGTVVLWWTPEYDQDATLFNLHSTNSTHCRYVSTTHIIQCFWGGYWASSTSVTVVPGTTYNIVASWDSINPIQGTNTMRISLNNNHTYRSSDIITYTPASSLYIGSLYDSTKPSNGIIEGLTVYRRVLYDGTYGIDVGNGDEIWKINNGGSHTGSNNAATLTDSTRAWTTSELVGGTVVNQTDGSSGTITANTSTTITATLTGGTENDWDTGDLYIITGKGGVDPTLVTGSWDVVFALPTDQSAGTLGTTGQAWSHPHSSNLLSNGFFMDDPVFDGWELEGSPSATGSASTNQKIFGGGGYVTSDAANEGIYQDITVEAGDDWVIRAIAHSDGTSVPKAILYDQSNGAEIGSLTATSSASTRADPEVFIFTGEAPTDCTTLRVKLVNTNSSGTVYWHQVELLNTLNSNPSMEGTYDDESGGGGGTVNVAPGHIARNVATDGTDTIDKEITIVHSGLASQKLQDVENNESVGTINGLSSGTYFMQGGFLYNTTGTGNACFGTSSTAYLNQNASNIAKTESTSSTGQWEHRSHILRRIGSGYPYNAHQLESYTTITFYTDDVYVFQLDDVTLTVTPASEGNSAEGWGIRVDGRDTLTQTISGLTTTQGTIRFRFTPRHSASIWRDFGVVNNHPRIAQFRYDSNNYFEISTGSSDNQMKIYGQANGTIFQGTWDDASSITAGNSYEIEISYTSDEFILKVDDTERISIDMTSTPDFSNAPTTAYWGSGFTGGQQADAVYSDPSSNPGSGNITDTEETSAPYYKFGSKAAKLVAGANDYYTTRSYVESGTTYTLSAYVYDGTTGNVGGTVDNTVAQLAFEGSNISGTTYTDMGGGWWRLTYSVAASTSGVEYFGLYILNGKTVYVDGMQLEEIFNYASVGNVSTYCDGSLGDNYSWDGTAHESSSTRTGSYLRFDTTNNISATEGSISFWVKREYLMSPAPVLFRWLENGGNNLYTISCQNNSTQCRFSKIYDGTIYGSSYQTISTGTWAHIVATWDTTNGIAFYVNTNKTTNSNTDVPQNLPSTFTLGYYDTSFAPASVISDLKTFSTSLNDAEVTDLYYSGLVSHSEGIEVERHDDSKGQAPVAVWHFDEGYGTTAYDSSMYGNDLTISGADYVGDLNSSNPRSTHLQFDGTNSYLSRGADTDFAFGTKSFSVSGWFRHPSLVPSAQSLVTNYSSGSDYGGWKIYMNSSGNLCFAIDDDATWSPDDAACTTTTYADSSWHHFSAVKSGTSSITLYVDGQEKASKPSLTATGSLTNNSNLYVGVDSDGTSNHWQGFLDEIIIYPYARSADQVKTDATGGPHQTSATFGSQTTDNLSNGLVGWWKMESSVADGSSRIQYATSTYADPASATFSNTPTEGNLLVAIAAERAGTSESNFTISGSGWTKRVARDTLLTNDQARRTLVIWTKVAGSSEPTNIQVDNGTTNSKALLIQEYDDVGGTWTFEDSADNDSGTGSTSPLSSGTTGSVSAGNLLIITAGMWRNESSNVLTIDSWTNGIESEVELSGGTHQITLNSGYYNLDTSSGTKESSVSWTGTGHEASAAILVFSNTNSLAYEEITEDSSGSNYSLINNGGTTFTGGKFGNGSEHVPASTQYLSTATTINGIKTVSFWTNPDALTNYYVSLSESVYITSNSSGVLSATGFDNPKIYVNGVASTTIAADTWQLVTVTSDTAVNADQFYVGRQDTNYYDGTMDEVRLYNRTLSPNEVTDLYNWAPGPVSYHPLDEGSGTVSTYDKSGNGYTGTLTSITNANWVSGKFGSALDLDGSEDYIDVGTGPSTVNTVSFWVKPDSTSEHFIDLNGSAYISASSGTVSATGFTTPTYYINGVATTSPTISANTWTHIAVTTATSLSASDYDIGRLEGTDYLDGVIDDVKLYNYARTPQQVVSDMNAGHPAPGSPIGSAIGHWSFDEGYGNTAYNSGSCGLNNNGTIYESFWFNDGKFGKALGFDGYNDYVSIPLVSTKRYDMAVSLWLYWVGNNGRNQIIFQNGNPDTGSGWHIAIDNSDNNELGIICESIDTATTNLQLTPYTWQHLLVQRNTKNWEVYLDGKLINLGGAITCLPNTPTTYTIIGKSPTGNNSFYGGIDEVQFFDIALTADQVKLLYNQGKSAVFGAKSTDSSGNASWSSTDEYCPPGQGSACVGPVAEWKFDEKTGTTAHDTSGNGNNSTTWSGDTKWTTGRYGSGLYFDGDDDVVRFTESSATDLGALTDSYTVESWFKSKGDYSTSQVFVCKNDDSGVFPFCLFLTSSEHVRFTVRGDSDEYVTSSTTYNDGNWHHAAGVRDVNSDKVILYIDGKFIAEVTDDNTATAANNDDVSIGNAGASYTGYDFEGSIDDVKIYNYARTPAQIAWDYNRGAPVGHWKFDECSGTIVNDWAPGADPNSFVGSNGTINIGSGGTQDAAGTCSSGDTGDAWYNGRTGKFGSSLNFDGSDDYASVTDAPEISPTTHMSLSAWVKPSDLTSRAIAVKNNSYRLVTDSSGYPVCQIHSGAGWQTAATGTSALSTTSWQQVTCTYDQTNIKVYVNGVLKGQSSLATAIADNTNAFEIARDSGSTYSSFTGQIDDVKVWNYALTPEQIKLDHNQGAVRFGN